MTDDDDTLKAMFGAARKAPPDPSEALLARITADAAREHAARARRVPARHPPKGWREALGFGGWPAVIGLATAGVAGVWIGVADPAGLVSGQFGIGAYAELDPEDAGFGYSELAWGLK